MSRVSVNPVRHFRDHESGEMVGPGDTVEVSASRAVELLQNGLIEEYEMKTEPENKKAPEPSNKSAQKPATKPADKSKA